MSERPRVQAPTAEEIQRRFRHPLVHVARPIILGSLGVLGFVRRFKWTEEGVEKLRECDRPFIFAANHCSHADTAAILGTLPFLIRRRTCVAAALDVFGPASYVPKKTLRYFKRECLQIIVAAGFHAFAFDRYGPPLRSLRTALDLLRNDWSLLLYPEGTRSRTGKMAPFKPGVGVLAKMSGGPELANDQGPLQTTTDFLRFFGLSSVVPRPAYCIVKDAYQVAYIISDILGVRCAPIVHINDFDLKT